MNLNIIAQIFGIGAMVSLFLMYQQPSRKRLVISKLCADFCWVVHYFCIGAYGGMIPNFVGIFREIVFVNKDKKKWAKSILWPVVFIVFGWVLGLRTFNSPINILPITASMFVTIALWLNNTRITKIASFPVSATFLIYNIYVGSYIGIINESLSLLSIIIYFIKEFLPCHTKMKTKTTQSKQKK